MAAVITAIFAAITPIWTWVTTTFVPATSSDVTLVHVGLWSPLLMGIAFTFLSLVRKGGRGRR